MRQMGVALFVIALSLSGGMLLASSTEVLKITVGEPTFMSSLNYQNSSSLAVSRTGVVAAFYPKLGAPHMFYRTSTDGGKTWGPERDAPRQLVGGAESVALRDGGVLKFLTPDTSFKGEAEFGTSPMEGKFIDGWFTVHSTFAWFNDDFTKYTVDTVQVYMPDAVTTKHPELPVSYWPIFDKGKILQLANGDLLAPMYGIFNGDKFGRVLLSTSSDQGHTWRYYATICSIQDNPNPGMPGMWVGWAEPTIALLPNGKMVCVMRTQYAHYAAEYRPLYIAWSSDMGRTWTKPIPTNPQLMNIWPTLAVLDNGVVVCQYGRPGFHVVFSTNDGRTWRDRVCLSNLHEPIITGQFDMIKAGPNRVLVIGSDGGGIKVWPIDVERVKVSPAQVNLSGRVVDADGKPIAGTKVQLGPNRYVAGSWVEVEELDVWKAGHALAAPPYLGYRAVASRSKYPVAKTNADGRYEFKGIRRAEYVLTVEADGCAPQWRNVNVSVEPEQLAQDFSLKPGLSVRGRVLDSGGKPVPGACVVLDKLHVHADSDGWFSAAMDAPVPQEFSARVYKRYDGRWKTLEARMTLSEIAAGPIVLERAK